ENIAAQLSAFRRVVGNGADVATVAEFVAEAFASEVLDRQFGPLTLNAMFGPAVLLRGPTDNWRSDGEWSAVSIAYKPYAAARLLRKTAERHPPSGGGRVVRRGRAGGCPRRLTVHDAVCCGSACAFVC